MWLLPAPAAAQSAPHCATDQPPSFVFGFAELKAQLGLTMGEPVSCEYADPNGTGDTLQDTTAGLAFWRKSTNTPTFTDGWTHWALTAQGQVTWTALADTYFAAVLIPEEPASDAVIARRLEGDTLQVGLRTPLTQDRARQTVRVYVGPKS